MKISPLFNYLRRMRRIHRILRIASICSFCTDWAWVLANCYRLIATGWFSCSNVAAVSQRLWFWDLVWLIAICYLPIAWLSLEVATKMAAATNSATCFLMIPKGLTRKGSEVATSDPLFLTVLLVRML